MSAACPESDETVDLADAESVRYWTLEFRVSEADLRKAVRAVGADVRFLRYLLGT